MGKTWVIEDPAARLQNQKARRITTGALSPFEKNPATAYTLSVFFWGGGQIYNDQFRKGIVFLVAMLLLCAGAVLSLVYGQSLLFFLRSRGISAADAFLTAEILFLCALIFWTGNSGDAYHRAAKTRKTPFAGVRSRAYPFLCSLLIPGWGQFLNGQPVKGSIYAGLSVLGLFSLASVTSTLFIWSALEASGARFRVEEIFAVAFLFTPLIPFIWLFAGFDALKVSLDDIKKEPLFERIRSANNRRRTQGWVRGVFPHFRSTVFLALLFVILAIFIYRSFPGNFYLARLADVRARLQEQGMTIVPDLIGRLLPAAPPAGT